MDRRLLELLNARAERAIQIGRAKEKTDKPTFAPERESQIFDRLARANPGPLPAKAVRAIFREIISASRALEQPLRIAYWGPPSSHSHTAALERFGRSAIYVPTNSIADAFEAVERGLASYAIVPAENSTEGVIPYTLDLLVDSDLRVCGETFLAVSHHLLSHAESLEQVKRVYASPQPYAQCRNWLTTHMPAGVEFVDVPTTSAAAQRAAQEPDSAAVAGRAASEEYEVPILRERIEDSLHNRTRFLVVGFHEPAPSGRDKTSLLIGVEDRPGSLYRALGTMERHGINMSMIQSRPTKQRPWEYLFFIDIQGFITDHPVAEALADLQNACSFVRVLGSYPEAE